MKKNSGVLFLYGSFPQLIDAISGSGSPMYLKIDKYIVMKPFSTADTIQFLYERLPNPNPMQILTYYSIGGGVAGFYAKMKLVTI